jgi:hypothetical protein
MRDVVALCGFCGMGEDYRILWTRNDDAAVSVITSEAEQSSE